MSFYTDPSTLDLQQLGPGHQVSVVMSILLWRKLTFPMDPHSTQLSWTHFVPTGGLKKEVRKSRGNSSISNCSQVFPINDAGHILKSFAYEFQNNLIHLRVCSCLSAISMKFFYLWITIREKLVMDFQKLSSPTIFDAHQILMRRIVGNCLHLCIF